MALALNKFGLVPRTGGTVGTAAWKLVTRNYPQDASLPTGCGWHYFGAAVYVNAPTTVTAEYDSSNELWVWLNGMQVVGESSPLSAPKTVATPLQLKAGWNQFVFRAHASAGAGK